MVTHGVSSPDGYWDENPDDCNKIKMETQT